MVGRSAAASRTPRPTTGDPAPARTGRRPGNPDTRQAILDAARATFADLGYTGASMRKIANAAGVDPALVHHYFGTKENLFLATVEVPVDLPDLLQSIAAQGADGLGLRLARTMIAVWESPTGASLAAALRAAMADPARARMLREFLVPRIVGPLVGTLALPSDEVELRSGLLMTQILGVLAGRYLLAVEPLASLPTEQLAANVGATIQRYLTGPLAELTPVAGAMPITPGMPVVAGIHSGILEPAGGTAPAKRARTPRRGTDPAEQSRTPPSNGGATQTIRST
jgi:AcrR family transcriptional regulator